MNKQPNLGRVINVPGKSQLWSSINEIVFRLLLGHFLLGKREWETSAIKQLSTGMKYMGEQPNFMNYDVLSGSEQIALNVQANFWHIENDLYGSYKYVAFEHAHGALMEWSDVNGDFVDKYDYWFATYEVLHRNVIPAIYEWIEEVQASFPGSWTYSKGGFNYPIFSWNEEKQTTVFASATWRVPNR